MSLRQTLYFLGKAIQDIRQDVLINLISIGAISFSLLIISSFIVVFLNLIQFQGSWKDNVRVTIYLDNTLLREDIKKVQKRIADFKEVASVTYISKEEALYTLQQLLQTNDNLLEGLHLNPLPDSLEVRFQRESITADKIANFASVIEEFWEVTDVQYDQERPDAFSRVLDYFGIGSLILGICLLLAGVMVISNTIKRSIYARRKELEIMSFIGATDFFVRAPFLIGGVLQGILGAFVSFGLLHAGYRICQPIMDAFPHLYPRGESPWVLSPQCVIVLMIGGLLMGILGCTVSFRRFLKV